MNYVEYDSPIGKIYIQSDGDFLTGLWLEHQKYFPKQLGVFKEDAVLLQAKKWLDKYFRGENPKISLLPLKPSGTFFQQRIWQILMEIPYGKTTTYKNIAIRLADELQQKHPAYQAVGMAVGHNPISIIIPCHRVIGTNNCLTGYAGGLERKAALLNLEKASFMEREDQL